jgi:hypothetical protein
MIIRSSAKDTDDRAYSVAEDHTRQYAMSRRKGLAHAAAPSEDALFGRDADYWPELSTDDEPSEPEGKIVEPVEAEETPTTDVEQAETPATSGLDTAHKLVDPLPGEEANACAVMAAIARLSVFVDSVCVDRPSDEVSGSAPNFDVGEWPHHSAPDREHGSAVKRLGFEVARIVKMTDARLDRIEIAGANQIAELRTEIEQMIVGLAARIEEIEARSALAAAAPEELNLRPEDPSHPDFDLFGDASGPGKEAVRHPDAHTAFTPRDSEEGTATWAPPLDPAFREPHECAVADLTTADEDEGETASVLSDQYVPPDTNSECAADDLTAADQNQGGTVSALSGQQDRPDTNVERATADLTTADDERTPLSAVSDHVPPDTNSECAADDLTSADQNQGETVSALSGQQDRPDTNVERATADLTTADEDEGETVAVLSDQRDRPDTNAERAAADLTIADEDWATAVSALSEHDWLDTNAECAAADLTTAGEDRGETVSALSDQHDWLDTNSEVNKPEKIDASRGQAEKTFWNQVREKLFHRYI